MVIEGYCCLYEPYAQQPLDNIFAKQYCYATNDKKKVPLCWNHKHGDPSSVIGNAILESRPDGIFVSAELNDAVFAWSVKNATLYLSAFITNVLFEQLIPNEQTGKIPRVVVFGNIREVSLVRNTVYTGTDANKVIAREVRSK